MFIVTVTYKVALEKVDKHLPDHVEFLKAQYAQGNFIASGRQIPRTGGIILSNMPSREMLEKVLSTDPFNVNGVADYSIVEFVPSMTCSELDFLKVIS